ncbi:MAG TPA: AraC family transcriptional regulator [Pseudobdellovibrionaceae bacterium]|nr:AraC family transcriptional regulator [Pseudobdellovibrionaceae bacterium]
MSALILERIKTLVDQIETKLDQDLQVLELANQCEISPWYFQRLFKGLVGEPLGSYLRGRRLSRAAELLRTTNKGILDIALEVGFNSHEAFTRSFKSQFEVTPTEVRSQQLSLKLRDKPLLTDELIRFLSTRINKEPEITIIPERRIVGYAIEIASPFVDLVHCSTIADPWMKLLSDLPNFGIEMKSAELYGLTLSPSGNFTEDLLNYVAGICVSKDFNIPSGMIEVILPPQKSAVFQLATHVVDDNLKQKVDSIYGYWLMSSEYCSAPRLDRT